jgi:hypothetical protein
MRPGPRIPDAITRLRLVTDTNAVLDAEYRALIRSLHSETIETIVAVETWWTPNCFRIASLGGYDPDEDGRDPKAAADAIEDQWRKTVHPRMLTLVHGHPDPDVRDAADFLNKRLWSMILLVGTPRGKRSDDENSVAIHLVHDGFKRLRRAAYHAPFRADRPVPRYDGAPIGNTEPLPGKMLSMIKQLQADGALEEGDPLWGRGIAEAVEQLSAIFSMPDEARRARLEGLKFEVPATDEAEPESDTLKFGFAP